MAKNRFAPRDRVALPSPTNPEEKNECAFIYLGRKHNPFNICNALDVVYLFKVNNLELMLTVCLNTKFC